VCVDLHCLMGMLAQRCDRGLCFDPLQEGLAAVAEGDGIFAGGTGMVVAGLSDRAPICKSSTSKRAPSNGHG
jgi:hypothetical protein